MACLSLRKIYRYQQKIIKCIYGPMPIVLPMNTQTVTDVKVLLVFTAVKAEYDAISSAVKHWTLDTPRGVRATGYDEVVVEQIGVRGKNLRNILPKFAHTRLAGVITAGVAGALDPDLGVGDVVIDSASMEVDRVVEFINAMSGGARVHKGPIHTSKTLVSTVAEKKLLFAQNHCLAVEMESQYTRSFAEHRKLPWLSVRAISDSAIDAIPRQVVHFVDRKGNMNPFGITMGLAMNPMLIPQVVRLGRNTTLATKRLSDVMGAVIRSGWPF